MATTRQHSYIVRYKILVILSIRRFKTQYINDEILALKRSIIRSLTEESQSMRGNGLTMKTMSYLKSGTRKQTHRYTQTALNAYVLGLKPMFLKICHLFVDIL